MKKKQHPLVRKILLLMGALLCVEVLILVGTVFAGGVIRQLDRNAVAILHEKVQNRRSYLENEMVNTWANVTATLEEVNDRTQHLLETGQIDLDVLDDGSEQAAPLVQELVEPLIRLMRKNSVTGAFVVLNTEDLEDSHGQGQAISKPGLYLRDMDPRATPSVRNQDLLFECAPTQVVRNTNIPTNTNWTPTFDFKQAEETYFDFFYQPFSAAYAGAAKGSTSPLDYGYWSMPYILNDPNVSAISYSVPLILEDGTLYGVLGVDVTLAYLRKAIPHDELMENKLGSYILGVQSQEGGPFRKLLVNGPIYAQASQGTEEMVLEEGRRFPLLARQGETEFACDVQYLSLYNSNTPFEMDQWAVIGAVRSTDLFAFTDRISRTLAVAVLITFLVGIGGSCVIGLVISRPIGKLTRHLSQISPIKAVKLPRAGIREVDLLAQAIEQLNQDVFESTTKFSRIIEMASVGIGGFEVNKRENSVFVTDKFFPLFGMEGPGEEKLTAAEFARLLGEVEHLIYESDPERSYAKYRLEIDGQVRYLLLNCSAYEDGWIGLAEDVTNSALEIEMIEYERDHDVLTTLYNRRAFHRTLNKLFDKGPQTLKVAALVMLDLDDLKGMNDTYGHDCGDKYIQCASECFVSAAPEKTLISRVSGDEFYLFYYGYDSREQVLEQLAKLTHAIDHTHLSLPGQGLSPLRVSGGVAWYPRDSQTAEGLLKYSDFAMYRAKHTGKGKVGHFDLEEYQAESGVLQRKAELRQMIAEQRLEYHFQPIFSAKTGDAVAYEALMRPNLPTLHSPDGVLALAKVEGRLAQIEELTWFCAMERYRQLLDSGEIPPGRKIFINSISSQAMPFDRMNRFEQMYKDHLADIVLEVTEGEELTVIGHQYKMQWIKKWGAQTALDDYGSGYNSEKLLLTVSPDYIKVDAAIIRDIHMDRDKQQIVENILNYAHQRGMQIIAEAIETEEEAAYCVRQGVDLLQGFYFSRPAAQPGEMSLQHRQQIEAWAQTHV